MTDDDSGAFGGAPPKLTIGQRLLAALPNLQRQTPPVAPTRESTPSRPSRSSSSGPDANSDVDVDPDDFDAPDDDTASDDIEATATPTGLSGRLNTLLNPSSPGTRPRPADELESMTREEIAHRIKRLDDRERFLALTSAPIGIAVGILLTAFAIHLNPPLRVHGKLNSKHVSDSLILLEGGVRVLLSGVVVACALTRRRSLVGFSLLFLGTAMGSPLFALPFWVLGGYLIWRVFKYQRVLTAKTAAARGTTRAGTGRGTGRAETSGADGFPPILERQGAPAPPRRAAARPVPRAPGPQRARSHRSHSLEALHPAPPDATTAAGSTVLSSPCDRLGSGVIGPGRFDEERRSQQPEDLLSAAHQ